ncbi:hypothetical protein GCM10012286_06280 [Streptomyces lasiicapitis]|uniref:Uncharacterized protein n=1 Tax=Streptomyces lasiicapitis TaxID=1923961 RepID=A0ABQ2LIL3_9ACTN|nr:hypothetical protein GCM10012286_06280 [Streptomyces lasiicapitis]
MHGLPEAAELRPRLPAAADQDPRVPQADPGAVELIPGFTRAVTGLGHRGTGDLELQPRKEQDPERYVSPCVSCCREGIWESAQMVNERLRWTDLPKAVVRARRTVRPGPRPPLDLGGTSCCWATSTATA